VFVRSWRVGIAVVAIVAFAAFVGGCGDGSSELLAKTDVREAFADEGLNLVVDEDKFRGARYMRYTVDGTERVVCFVFDDPRTVPPYMKMAKRAANVARALAVRNVVVLLLPEATPDERRRALAAVETLRRG
jgi:hypothetical protein